MAKQRKMSWHAMFADRVQPTVAGCLEFTGCRNHDGYGAVTCGQKKWSAHRLSYFLANGEIPESSVVMHSCDNPACINPAHLGIGTIKDNVIDMERKGRARKSVGSAHGQSKLEEADVRLIRSSPESGASLARRLGVSKVLVCQIRRGIGWSHVGESNVA